MTICERMFSIIEAKKPKVNASALGKLLEVSSGQMTSWKQRNADPPARYIAAIAEYLDVSVEYLLTGTETEYDISNNMRDSMSEDEVRIVKKYRALDDDGKDAVKGILLQEQRRVEAEKGTGIETA